MSRIFFWLSLCLVKRREVLIALACCTTACTESPPELAGDGAEPRNTPNVETVSFELLFDNQSSRLHIIANISSSVAGSHVLPLSIQIPPFAQHREVVELELLSELGSGDTISGLADSESLSVERFTQSIAQHRQVDLLKRRLHELEPIAQARMLTSWVGGYVTAYQRTGERHGALYAFVKQRGDCTEMADLLVAMAREFSLPARLVSGYLLDGSGRAERAIRHDWVEFNIDNSWHIADPLTKTFQPPSGLYLGILREGLGSKAASANSLAFFSIDNPDIQLRYRLVSVPVRVNAAVSHQKPFQPPICMAGS